MALFVTGGLGQGVLNGISSVVVGLAAGADYVCGGGEHVEEGEGGGFECFLEVECALEFGVEREIESFERHGGEAAVLWSG